MTEKPIDQRPEFEELYNDGENVIDHDLVDETPPLKKAREENEALQKISDFIRELLQETLGISDYNEFIDNFEEVARKYSDLVNQDIQGDGDFLVLNQISTVFSMISQHSLLYERILKSPGIPIFTEAKDRYKRHIERKRDKDAQTRLEAIRRTHFRRD